MSSSNASVASGPSASAPTVKPIQPDQKAFQEEQAQLKKEHDAAMAKFVCADHALLSPAWFNH